MDFNVVSFNSVANSMDTVAVFSAPTDRKTPDLNSSVDKIEPNVVATLDGITITNSSLISVNEHIIPAENKNTLTKNLAEVTDQLPYVEELVSGYLASTSNELVSFNTGLPTLTTALEPNTDIPMEPNLQPEAMTLDPDSEPSIIDVSVVPDTDLFVIDTVGNEFLAPAEKAVPKSVAVLPAANSRCNLKVAAKYQWRQGAGFSEDVGDDNDSDSSDDDFEEEFKFILHGHIQVNENPEPRTVNEKSVNDHLKESKKNRKLDNDYYDLPDLGNLSLLCIDSLVLAPFATVVQHYDALLMLKAVPNVPYLNMDTMLFTENKTLIGTIYELMGLVSDPIYNVLFPSVAECEKIPLGTIVYYAPTADETVTKLLFLDDLRNASYWKNDEADSDGNEEEDEEAHYFSNLRKQLEEYEKRKRRSDTTNRSSSISGPRQPKQARRDRAPAMPRLQLRTFAGFIPTACPSFFGLPKKGSSFGMVPPPPPSKP